MTTVVEEEVQDARLVRVIIKIRTEIARVNKEYDAKIADLKAQKKQVEVEVLRRLQQRGATQTKTVAGTSYITETMTLTIADEEAYGRFVLEQQDYGFYQKRAKVEHVQAWSKNHDGRLPPGLNSFRELEINTRAPKRVRPIENPPDEGEEFEESE